MPRTLHDYCHCSAIDSEPCTVLYIVHTACSFMTWRLLPITSSSMRSWNSTWHTICGIHDPSLIKRFEAKSCQFFFHHLWHCDSTGHSLRCLDVEIFQFLCWRQQQQQQMTELITLLVQSCISAWMQICISSTRCLGDFHVSWYKPACIEANHRELFNCRLLFCFEHLDKY